MDEDTPEDEAAAAAEADIPKLNYPVFDGYSSLVFLIVKNWDVVRAAIPTATAQVKAQIVARALNAIVSVLGAHAERDGAKFNQRPFFRLFLCMLMDMNTADHVIEPIYFHNLSALSNSLQQCNPSKRPSFVFAWLELISHRLFMPKMLTAKGQRGWVLYQRLISQLFLFIEPYLRNLQLTDSMRLLYKGTLRVLLVLLHDFPEFLSDNHFLFCDVLPVCCVQMRNLVLSAFPRNMKLPDPFMPNLKVDLLPDIKVSPRILSNYSATLNQHAFKADLDQFFRTREQGILRSPPEPPSTFRCSRRCSSTSVCICRRGRMGSRRRTRRSRSSSFSRRSSTQRGGISSSRRSQTICVTRTRTRTTSRACSCISSRDGEWCGPGADHARPSRTSYRSSTASVGSSDHLHRADQEPPVPVLAPPLRHVRPGGREALPIGRAHLPRQRRRGRDNRGSRTGYGCWRRRPRTSGAGPVRTFSYDLLASRNFSCQ